MAYGKQALGVCRNLTDTADTRYLPSDRNRQIGNGIEGIFCRMIVAPVLTTPAFAKPAAAITWPQRALLELPILTPNAREVFDESSGSALRACPPLSKPCTRDRAPTRRTSD